MFEGVMTLSQRKAHLTVNGRSEFTTQKAGSEKMWKLLVAVTVLACSVANANAQDLAAGEMAFRKCMACHDVGEKAKNKVGPSLNGLDGRKSGTIDGYNYSDANRNSGIIWGDAQFLSYIKDPKAKVPATKMVFAGIKSEAEAKALWEFLKQFGPDGKKK